MRRAVAVSLGCAAGIFGFATGLGLTGSRLAGALLALLAAGLTAVRVLRRDPVPLDPAAASRGLRILAGLATVAALVQLCRLAVFMAAPQASGFSSVPGSDWETRHSCLTAYHVAAEAAGAGQDVYDPALYNRPDDDPSKVRKARRIGLFNVDVYEYPPPFLLLPRALHLAAPDFLRLRPLWFGLGGAFALAAFLAVARRLGPAVGTRALLLSPLVWAALPTLSTLQKGNVQLPVIAAGLLAMLLFERRRWAAGGALLAFITVSKLFPGLLAVYLLARREWRALGWTVGWSAAFALLALLDLGWAPYQAFLHHLPGLLGGEAFPAFRNPAATAINFSIPGLAFKLKLFGVPGMGFGASKLLGWIYTLVALAATVQAARRSWRGDETPLVWLAILILATLRSPFLPQAYAAFPPLWLLILLAARQAPTAKTLSLLLLGWAALNVFWPVDWPVDPRLLAAANLLPQGVTIVLAVLALRQEIAAGRCDPAATDHQRPRAAGVPGPAATRTAGSPTMV